MSIWKMHDVHLDMKGILQMRLCAYGACTLNESNCALFSTNPSCHQCTKSRGQGSRCSWDVSLKDQFHTKTTCSCGKEYRVQTPLFSPFSRFNNNKKETINQIENDLFIAGITNKRKHMKCFCIRVYQIPLKLQLNINVNVFGCIVNELILLK